MKIYFAYGSDRVLRMVGGKIGANPRSTTLKRVIHNLNDSVPWRIYKWVEVTYSDSMNIKWTQLERAYQSRFAKRRVRNLGKDSEWFRIKKTDFIEFAKFHRSNFGKKRVRIEEHEILNSQDIVTPVL